MSILKDKTAGLKEFAAEKTRLTLEKVDKAIRNLSLSGKSINFNSVSEQSGVTKSFLYTNLETRQRIEELRKQEISKEMNQRLKTDKNSKSKDIILMAKDKKIRELDAEVKKLRKELEILRGKVYNNY